MPTYPCHCCDRPCDGTHADDAPVRYYCDKCSGCDRLPGDERCDKCWVKAQHRHDG